jgi:putative NADH-flavin reductase
MKVTIIGATGGVGRQAVEQAATANDHVTAVVRNPQQLPRDVPYVSADLATADSAALEPAVAGADLVLSCLGPRSAADGAIVTRGTRLVLEAMKATGARRLVLISAAPVATVPSPAHPNPPRRAPGDGFLKTNVLNPMLKAAFRSVYADLAQTEDVVRDSDLEWTIVRAPRLTNKPLTGTYRTAYDRNLERGFSISRADLAHYMLQALDRPDAVRQIVRIAY